MSVDASSSGLYRCEVSAEAPGFETADREAHFNVIGKFEIKSSILYVKVANCCTVHAVCIGMFYLALSSFNIQCLAVCYMITRSY